MDRKDFDLRDAFPVTPEDVKRTLMNAAHSVKEEEKMKRFSIRTLAVAALIIVATTALAYAAFHSQVAEFFGSQYGKETQAWLEQGKVALPEDSVEVGSVTFQMKEVVYQNRGLYGLVAVKGEGADTALIRVDRIGVDEGELLPVKVVGYGDEKQPDGSILHSFEVSYGLVIGEGESFTLQLTAVSDTGSKEWFVKIKPEIVVAQTKLPDTSETEQQIVTDGFELLVPDEFKETGTLPVYKAQERDFGASIRPELFNQSSIAKRDQSTVRFEDGSILDWAPEAVFYNEHQGTYNVNYKEPDLPAQDTPSRTLSNQAGSLAASAKFGWYHGEEMPGDLLLHRTELSNISLESAEDQVEALLAELDVTGYTRVFALDMDVSRIKALGESENRWIRQDNNPSNAPVFDYTKVTEANEGYYLVYENALSKGSDGASEVAAYVTHEGIVKLTLRDAYQKGDLLTTPEKLLAPETILEQLPAEIARSRFSDMTVKKIISIELVYATARDDKQGLVMTPAWLVNYYDTENEAYEAYAVFNAVDGSLLSAKFN